MSVSLAKRELSISPSVYVAYRNLRAVTQCTFFATFIFGPQYNTTIAYRPEDLTTSHCFQGRWKAINYTELQYPPPNSLVTDCADVGHGYPGQNPSYDEHQVATTPQFSWPSNLNLLKPSWVTCAGGLGAYDPPRMLGEATAMVPITSTTVPAAPGMPVVPNHAPATPTPSTATRQHEVPSSASLLESPMEASAVSLSKAWPKSGSQVQSSLLGSDAPSNDPAGKAPRPDNTKPPVEDPISDSGFPSETSTPSPNEPSRTGLVSVDASTVTSSRQMNAPSDSDISVPSRAFQAASSVQTQRLGDIITSVFAFMPGATVNTASDKAKLPDTSSDGFKSVDVAPSAPHPPSVIVNGVATALHTGAPGRPRIQVINIGGQSVTLSQALADIILGDQTVTPGGPAVTMSSATISIPAFPGPKVESNSDTASPLAEVIYTVGGQTLVADPTEIVIQGSTIQAGQPPLTIAGTPTRSQSSGKMVIGDSTFQVSTIQASPAKADPEASTAAPSAQIYTVNNQTLRGNPSAISMAGTTLLAGESGIDIAGTLVSLQPSGGLIIGDSTVFSSDFPAAATRESVPALIVGGQTLQANPTSIMLAGSVLTAGGSGVTIEGTRISLGTSGGLIVGDSTIPIKPIGLSTESITTSVSPHTTGVQSTDASSTAVSLSGTMTVSDGAEVTIGGTLISMEAPVNSTSGSGAALASSSSQLAQPTHTASKGRAARLSGGMELLFRVIASSVAALFLECINLL